MESLTEKENGVAREQIIRKLIREFTDLMCNLEQGFSPAQLVERLHPFQVLTANDRLLLKEQIHRRFVQDFQLAARKERFERVAGEFLEVLDLFLGTFAGDKTSAQSAMIQVQDFARRLIRELEDFPKGIWLWKALKNEKIKS